MSPFIRLAYLLLLLLKTTCDAFFFPPRVHMKVYNNLENGLVLTTHCQSKNDDLGVISLPKGGTFEFSFKPNIFATTLFFCRMDWKGASHYFDIYIYNRDYDLCPHTCWWSVKERGPCLYDNDSGKYDLCYPWNKSQNNSHPQTSGSFWNKGKIHVMPSHSVIVMN